MGAVMKEGEEHGDGEHKGREKAWKAVLSEAVVTGDEVLGKGCQYVCLEGSTSLFVQLHVLTYLMRGTVFQTVALPFGTRDYVPGYDRFA